MQHAEIEALRTHLGRLYDRELAVPALDRLVEILEDFARSHPAIAERDPAPFDERDVWVIAYGDHLTEPGRPPLRSLDGFLREHFGDVVGGLHLLPHYPWTSDDGFAVVDHREVDPRLGDWSDVERLGDGFRLMLDAVVNHTSASAPWFQGWLRDDPEFADFYLSPPVDADLSRVVRPRTTPLLTPFPAPEGVRQVWTTFGPDQVDLNYANPEVLLRVTEILLEYVGRGARALRLDAIAFLWKRAGTSCIHLPETHEVIRLWRTVLDAVAPGTLIVTETNVPHAENVAYFGDGTDEAHLVYQFPLPPLVLHAFRGGDSSVLAGWLRDLEAPSAATTFLNFLGSHDGIGLRPVEQLLPTREVAALGEAISSEGGGVSYRSIPGHPQFPYELNVSYFDALNPPDPSTSRSEQIDRFVAAQSLLLALAGVPAIYLHALLGSRNWHEGVALTGHPRAINREKLVLAEVEAALEDPGTLRSEVAERIRGRAAARIAEPAFHPCAAQRVLDTPPGLLAIERTATDGSSTVVCVHNLTAEPERFRLPADGAAEVPRSYTEIVDGRRISPEASDRAEVTVAPYEVLWLRA